MSSKKFSLTLLTTFVLLAGCNNEEPPKTPAAVGNDTLITDQEAAAIPEKSPNQGNVQIDSKLAKLCELPSAYFPFDSANLSPASHKAMQALVDCFTAGKAKGESLRIVGHADPRGETDYNFGLGQQRAGSVAGHLQKLGLDESRMETSSRGELDATGSDEASWAKDRKVELFLAD